MKKLIFAAIVVLLAMFLAACGPPDQGAGGGEAGGDTGGAQQTANTPTPVVLATPTPKPAPPTPTPRPSPTPAPIESAAESEGEGEAGAEGTVEPEAEAEPEVAAGPLFEDMVLIPAGPFTIGEDSSAKDKNKPAHQVDLPAFEIDRFEVTNDEFAHFVDVTGYVTYAEENSSKNWRDAAEGKGNHPVVYVTLDDAVAYCEWAGKHVPTEEEWEKAARGDDGRIFPWGNDFTADTGNFYEGGIRGTTAVGSFPSGASPYGVEDMAGNVREWTTSPYLPYEGYTPPEGNPDRFNEAHRVNRGGGWFDGEDGELVTTYNRNAGPPDTSANDDIGFRCVRDVE